MLPMTLQFIIVMIASAISDRLQRRLDYVEEESRILQEHLDADPGGKKLSFTADQRRRLATAGKLLTPGEREKCCHLVRPATIGHREKKLAKPNVKRRRMTSSGASCPRAVPYRSANRQTDPMSAPNIVGQGQGRESHENTTCACGPWWPSRMRRSR